MAQTSELGAAVSFGDLVKLLVFLTAVWIAGRIAEALRAPAVIGFVLAGACLGPPLAHYAPQPAALELLGELGLVILTVSGGLETDLGLLRSMGIRGVCIAFAGSLCGPFLLGIGFSKALGGSTKEALAVGASLSPTSLACALTALRAERVLNTPVGQAVLAAAVVDDIISLVLLSELAALNAPSAAAYAAPIAAGVGFTLVVGAGAVYVTPVALAWLVPLLPAAHVKDTVVLLLAMTTLGLMVALHAGRASNLLGAFLAGLGFCTLQSVHAVWHGQVKRIQSWTVRLFFACTVGFQVPIQQLWTAGAWRHGAFFFVASFGKLATGLLCGAPLSPAKCLTVGFAMVPLGEIAFLIAVTARQQGLMEQDTYAGVIIAILLSLMVGPVGLRAALRHQARVAAKALAGSGGGGGSGGGAGARRRRAVVFYRLNIRAADRWGLLPDVLRSLGDAGVDVLECRVASEPLPRGRGGGGAAARLALVEAYLRDRTLTDDAPLTAAAAGLPERLAALRRRLAALLAHDAEAAAADGGAAAGCDVEAEAFGDAAFDYAALRGLRLVRWLPGEAPEEWARAGLEGNEEAATTLMREAATPGRRPRLHEIAWSVRTEAEDGLPHSSRAADAAPPPSTTASPRLWRPSSVAAADYAINSAAAAAAASRAAARSEGPTLLRSNTPKRLEFRRVLSQPAPRVVPVAGASTAGAGGGSGDDAVAADVECMPQRDVGLRSGADFARAVAAFRDTL